MNVKSLEIIQVWVLNWVVCCHTADCYNTLAAMYISSAYCLLFCLSVFISVVFVSIHPSIRNQLLLESAANLCWKTAVAVWREKKKKKKKITNQSWNTLISFPDFKPFEGDSMDPHTRFLNIKSKQNKTVLKKIVKIRRWQKKNCKQTILSRF